jgi:hypothetical protein
LTYDNLRSSGPTLLAGCATGRSSLQGLNRVTFGIKTRPRAADTARVCKTEPVQAHQVALGSARQQRHCTPVVGAVPDTGQVTNDPVLVRVGRLVDEALETFDTPGVTVSSLVRKAQRIAFLRHDYAKQIGLWMQTTDVANLRTAEQKATEIPAFAKAQQQLATLVGAEGAKQELERQYQTFERSRQTDDGKIIVLSVSQLEDNVAAIQGAYDDAEPPSGLTPVDTYFAAERARKTRADLIAPLQTRLGILGRVRQDVHDYLVSVETDLLAGKANSDIFQRAQLYINEALRRYAPDALEMFVAAQERLSSGSSEDYAHALASCRRVIKELADALYPASKELVEGIDGANREMTDERYKNRLTEYVRTQVEGKRQRQTVVQIVSDLYSRLNALDGLASKGVHDKVTEAEAETCVVWTYMLAGDIVRIADGTSAQLVGSD